MQKTGRFYLGMFATFVIGFAMCIIAISLLPSGDFEFSGKVEGVKVVADGNIHGSVTEVTWADKKDIRVSSASYKEQAQKWFFITNIHAPDVSAIGKKISGTYSSVYINGVNYIYCTELKTGS